MRILYHIPFTNTVYAGRTIYHGYKNAFEDMGHEFRTWTANDEAESLFEEFQPQILMSGFGIFSIKYIDIPLVQRYKKEKNLKVFVSAPFWKSPLSKLRVNEMPSLSDNAELVKLIKEGYGDIYYNVCEQGDPRMDGFEKETGYHHYTLPLAADKTFHFPEFEQRFEADISFIGTNLPDKRPFFKKQVYPLKKDYDLKLYGQDWTMQDKLLGWSQKIGQYFNLPGLRSIQKPKLQLEDERKIYSSSKISINVHEEYQRNFGNDCNERTFKIPVCGGFEITDDVECIRKYFKDGKEIVIAKNVDDWFEKIHYYMANPQERQKISEAGKVRVLAEHTYHNRIQSLLELYQSL